MGGIRSVAIPAAASAAAALVASFLIGGVGGSDPSAEPTVSDSATSSQAPSEGPATEAPAGSTSASGTQVDAADLPALGIQFHGTWSHYTDAKREAVLDKIEESGATWVRLDVSWAMIQSSPGEYDMNYGVPLVDTVIDQLRQRDLKVLVMFWRTPQWASGDPSNENVAPQDPADYASALEWAADRWGDEVDAWQVWNEPNLDYFFEGTDPTQYTDLLCAGYGAVKRGDPDAQVVYGGIVGSDVAWLRSSYDAGARGCFDVMAVHSYSTPGDLPPSSSDTADGRDLGSLARVDAVMRAQDDAHSIWLTEFGWSAHTDAVDTEPWRRGVTEEKQAEYAEQALEILARDLPYVTQAFWYKDVVNPQSSDMQQEGYAMLRGDLTPRPVFDTFRSLYAQG